MRHEKAPVVTATDIGNEIVGLRALARKEQSLLGKPADETLQRLAVAMARAEMWLAVEDAKAKR